MINNRWDLACMHFISMYPVQSLFILSVGTNKKRVPCVQHHRPLPIIIEIVMVREIIIAVYLFTAYEMKSKGKKCGFPMEHFVIGACAT